MCDPKLGPAWKLVGSDVSRTLNGAQSGLLWPPLNNGPANSKPPSRTIGLQPTLELAKIELEDAVPDDRLAEEVIVEESLINEDE